MGKNFTIMSVILLISGAIIPSALTAEEYAPYPILFVHGLGSSAATWDTTRNWDTGLGYYFKHITPRYPGWNEVTKPYLEAFSISNSWETVDFYGATGNKFWAAEVTDWIKNTLNKYYGSWWVFPDAKLIVVCHSTGAPAIREALRLNPELVPHIAKIITIGGVNNGSPWANFPEDVGMLLLAIYWYPGFQTPVPSDVTWLVNAVNWVGKIGLDAIVPIAGGIGFVASIFLHLTSGAVCDLARGSNLMNTLNSEPLPELEKGYASIVGTHWLPNLVPDVIMGLSVAQAAIAYWSAFTGSNPNGWWVGTFKLLSGIFIEDWVRNSDMLVWEKSANLKAIYPDNEDIEVLPIDAAHMNAGGFFPDAEPNRWDVILDAIEEPPVIHLDSLMLEDNLVVSLNPPMGNVITDTITDLPKVIYGRVNDYLLASNSFRYNINYSGWKDNSWSTGRLGYSGNAFYTDRG